MLCSPPHASVVLDHMFIRAFEIHNIVPEPQHFPENDVVQKPEFSCPIDVVNELPSGD